MATPLPPHPTYLADLLVNSTLTFRGDQTGSHKSFYLKKKLYYVQLHQTCNDRARKLALSGISNSIELTLSGVFNTSVLGIISVL